MFSKDYKVSFSERVISQMHGHLVRYGRFVGLKCSLKRLYIRFGFDFGARYQITDHIYFDTDATITKARSLEAVSGEDYIPLAPNFTMSGGLTFTGLGNFSGGFRYRYLADRAANEDNSITAKGYFVSDLNINYKMEDITFGVSVENLFDVAWNETQFATESRLQNEVNSVEEIHFTPGTPFFAKATITYNF